LVFQLLKRETKYFENLYSLRINDRQVKAMMYIKEHGKITNSIYQDLNEVSKPTATRDLQALTEKKVLKSFGSKEAGVYYELIGS
jgi:ATP-dependent DNA helicase RecG